MANSRARAALYLADDLIETCGTLYLHVRNCTSKKVAEEVVRLDQQRALDALTALVDVLNNISAESEKAMLL